MGHSGLSTQGGGLHTALCVCLCVCLIAQSCPTLCDPLDYSPPGSSVHRNLPGKNIGVGCHAFLQGIFPTQGSNPDLPHCRQILYQLSFKGSQKDTYSPHGTETENLKIRPKRATDFHMQPLLEGGYCLSTVKTAVAL